MRDTGIGGIHGMAILLVALLAAGCERATAPHAYVGSYALQSIDGAPLPAEEFTTGDATVFVVADTIVLLASGTGTQRHRSYALLHFLEPDGKEHHEWQAQLHWAVRRGRLEIEQVCPPNALCAPPPHAIGRLTADGLLLTPTYPDASSMRYARLQR